MKARLLAVLMGLLLIAGCSASAGVGGTGAGVAVEPDGASAGVSVR